MDKLLEVRGSWVGYTGTVICSCWVGYTGSVICSC